MTNREKANAMIAEAEAKLATVAEPRTAAERAARQKRRDHLQEKFASSMTLRRDPR